MKKSKSRSKATDRLLKKDQSKDGGPELQNRARLAGDYNPESHSLSSGNSGIHNGSANAFDATEEVRDNEDSDEDNDDFARDYK